MHGGQHVVDQVNVLLTFYWQRLLRVIFVIRETHPPHTRRFTSQDADPGVQLAACSALATMLDACEQAPVGVPCAPLVAALCALVATLDTRHWRVACAVANCASGYVTR